jgi:hypothetical protein
MALTPSPISSLQSTLSRRALLRIVAFEAVGLLTSACGGRSEPSAPTDAAAGSTTPDFSARFAAYQPSDEPNGDLAKVVWPAFVTRAGPDVQQLYEFQIQNGELMRYMPCFCGCGRDGHHNNPDCYVKAVNPDGSVVFDSMAPT